MEITLLIIGFVAGITATVHISQKQKKQRPQAQYKSKQYEKPPEIPLDQQFLDASRSCEYKAQKLLNNPEKQVYWSLVTLLTPKYCISAQVSLGEVLKCDDNIGYRAVMSKRGDFAVTDKKFNPVAIVEYQGSGHKQSNHAMRDQTKENALRKAGILYIELFSSHKDDVQKVLIENNLIDQSIKQEHQ